MRKEFEMTPQQLEVLMEAGKPSPGMWGSGGMPLFSSPQEKANMAWMQLSKEMGFVWDSVEPISGKGPSFFTAEVTEDK